LKCLDTSNMFQLHVRFEGRHEYFERRVISQLIGSESEVVSLFCDFGLSNFALSLVSEISSGEDDAYPAFKQDMQRNSFNRKSAFGTRIPMLVSQGN
jgi:hypothetical protein